MKKYLSVFLVILFVCAAPVSKAREVFKLIHQGSGIEAISATVDGGSGVYLFDSGLGVSGVTPSVAAAIGCKPWGKITGFRAIGERLDVPRCNGARLSIGGYAVSLPQLAVYDLSKFMGLASQGLSGALGLDIFQGRVVTLYIARHKLILEDASSLAAIRREASEVPIRIVRAAEGAALTVDLGVQTPSGMAWMELDTGNYGPSMIDKTIASSFGLDPDSSYPQDFHVHLATGIDPSGKAVVKNLIMDGDLGRGILRGLTITIDLKNRQAWIIAKQSSVNPKVQKNARSAPRRLTETATIWPRCRKAEPNTQPFLEADSGDRQQRVGTSSLSIEGG